MYITIIYIYIYILQIIILKYKFKTYIKYKKYEISLLDFFRFTQFSVPGIFSTEPCSTRSDAPVSSLLSHALLDQTRAMDLFDDVWDNDLSLALRLSSVALPISLII